MVPRFGAPFEFRFQSSSHFPGYERSHGSMSVRFQCAVGSRQAPKEAQSTATYLLLSISDTGKGIPKEKLPNIFDRFYQVDDSSTREGEGTGIGLTLTRELVKILGGEITVESEPGKGTCFQIQLPITAGFNE